MNENKKNRKNIPCRIKKRFAFTRSASSEYVDPRDYTIVTFYVRIYFCGKNRPPELFFKTKVFSKFRKIHKKTPASVSVFY